MNPFKIGKIPLTNREAQCLSLMMAGFTLQETASKLKISSKTVIYYRENIRKKFITKKRHEIFKLAFANGFPIKKFL